MTLAQLKSYLCHAAKQYFDADYLDQLNENELAWYIEVMRELYDGVPLVDSTTTERRESYNRKNRMRRDLYYIINQMHNIDDFVQTEQPPRWNEETSLIIYDAAAGRKEPRKRRRNCRRQSLDEFVAEEQNPNWQETVRLELIDAIDGRKEKKCTKPRKKRSSSAKQH